MPNFLLLAWLVSLRFGERRYRLQEPRRRKRMWVHPLVAQRTRKGQFHKLYDKLRLHPEKFLSFTRLTIATFDKLLEELRPAITFRDTTMRRCISAEERLLVTLRFLATGNSFSSLHFEFLLGTSTISQIVHHTCQSMWAQLQRLVMPQPDVQMWLDIAHQFETSEQFPNCLGALDVKHIRVQKPVHSGSRSYNSKQYFSVVLLALVDSNYKFIMVDIGAYGSPTDTHIFSSSRMGQQLQSGEMSLPEARLLPGSSRPPVPFVIVGDKGFGLTNHLLRPFAKRRLDSRKRVFNDRLTRARRYVKGAFGIMSSKWRVFQRPLIMDPDKVTGIIQACVLLHNFSSMHEAAGDLLQESSDPRPSQSDVLGPPVRSSSSGVRVRDIFADYFLSPEGFAPCQPEAIH